jgi:hypothetical protein
MMQMVRSFTEIDRTIVEERIQAAFAAARIGRRPVTDHPSRSRSSSRKPLDWCGADERRRPVPRDDSGFTVQQCADFCVTRDERRGTGRVAPLLRMRASGVDRPKPANQRQSIVHSVSANSVVRHRSYD